MSNKDIDGKPFYVGRAQKKSEREAQLRAKFEQMRLEQYSKYQGVNLYIKNLDDDFDDEKLLAEFKPFGSITSAKVMKDAKGTSRGFGFVCFTSPDEATRAVTEMNGKIVGTKPLYVALAQRKEARKAALEAQFQQRTTQKIPGVARGIPPALYANGAPLFYQQPGQPGFMYPPMVARGRFPPAPYQPMANWNVMVPGRGQGIKNGGRGIVPRGRGMKPVQPQAHITVPIVPPVVAPVATSVEPAQPPLTPTGLAAYSPEDQKRLLGDRLYGLISKNQPQLASKITGMILESTIYMDELFHLIEDADALNEKVNEALLVLKDHQTKQPTKDQ